MAEQITFKRAEPTRLTIQIADLLAMGAGNIVAVHPDDYRPSDPDDPDSPHLWQAGDRVTVTPFTVGELQPIHTAED
jgi:hypothetical protein